MTIDPKLVEGDPREGPQDRRKDPLEVLATTVNQRLTDFIERYDRDEKVRQGWRDGTDAKLDTLHASLESVLAPLRVGLSVAKFGLKLGCWAVAGITALGTAYTAAREAIDLFLHKAKT